MAAVGPWIRFVILTAQAVGEAAALYAQHYDQQKVDAAWEGRKLMCVWEKQTSSGGALETQLTTHHFVNLTNDAPDDTWTDEDFLVVEDAWDVRWGQIKPVFPTSIKLKEFRWYRFGPAVSPPSPALRVVPRDVPGTAATHSLPPQVAISVTERTPLRKRWGRFYLPAPAESINSEYGRLDTGQPAAIADEISSLYQSCRDEDIIPVVWSPTTESAHSIQQVQVDDLFDVIRSRRYKTPAVRSRLPA